MRDVHRRRQAVAITFLVMLLTASSLLDVAAAGPASIRRTEPPGLEQFMSAIARVESGGRYRAHNRESGAYGKYQIMPHSWRGWARQYLGNANARPTPRNQEIVAEAKLSALYRWLRDWRFVAYWWLTGRREVRTWRWSSYSQRYVNKVMFHYRSGMRAVEAAAAAAAAAAEQATLTSGPVASPAGEVLAAGDAFAAGVLPAALPSTTPAPTATPAPSISPTPSPVVAPSPTAAPTPVPSPSASPAMASAPVPSASPAASPAAAPWPAVPAQSPAVPAQSAAASPAASPAVAPLRFVYQESSRQIRFRGSWIRTRFAGYSGGAARYAETVGATATVSFTGRSIAWLGPVGPGRGRARVLVDGSPVRIVTLTAATLEASRPLFRTSWPEVGQHSVTIEVLGSSGGSKVAIDGFEIAR